MSETQKSDIRLLIETLRTDAGDYFRELAKYVEEMPLEPWHIGTLRPDYYWEQVSEESVQIGRAIAQRLVRYSAQIADAMRSAPLVGDEDLIDLRTSTKAMRAALQLRRYRFHEITVLNDEDRVLGVRPAGQSDDEALSPLKADVVFDDNVSNILRILALVEASADLSPSGANATSDIDAPRYRPGTAFVMMWMDPAHPELADICDAVKDTFRKFRINAVRADDIEHDGQITQRVLNELRTSEFLFADLTGARPNVYYEVGFAHALGRRVLLYRKSGTGIHFDLAGYNCPEYTNLRDLKDKLARRLESMTNRKADSVDGEH